MDLTALNCQQKTDAQLGASKANRQNDQRQRQLSGKMGRSGFLFAVAFDGTGYAQCSSQIGNRSANWCRRTQPLRAVQYPYPTPHSMGLLQPYHSNQPEYIQPEPMAGSMWQRSPMKMLLKSD